MNRAASSFDLLWTDGKEGAPVRKRIFAAAMGLGVLALAAVTVLAVMSVAKPGASPRNAAIVEAHGTYASVGRTVRNNARPGIVASTLTSVAQTGLGRSDSRRGQFSAAHAAPWSHLEEAYDAYASVGNMERNNARPGIAISAMNNSPQTGLGRSDSRRGQFNAAHAAPWSHLEEGYDAYASVGNMVRNNARPGIAISAMSNSAQTGLGRSDSRRSQFRATSAVPVTDLDEIYSRAY
jgi:hypothetical protein